MDPDELDWLWEDIAILEYEDQHYWSDLEEDNMDDEDVYEEEDE